MNNLREQFIKLQRRFHPETEVAVKISVIAQVLNCTPRNVRNILHAMQEADWVQWSPAIGRGRESRLIFNRTADELKHLSIMKLLEKGKLSQALNLIGDDDRELEKQLFKHLGAFIEGDYRLVRIPYYRNLDPIEPWKPQRRTERHILRQCFSGLTKYDQVTAMTVPDLAHHWSRNTDATVWDFFIRPGQKFSDGIPFATREVEKCLSAAKSSPFFAGLYRNISQINVISNVHIRFKLYSGDKDFPACLSHPSAFIYGRHEGQVVCTGPWQINEHDSYNLILKINPWYYGIRPIIDEVSILKVDPDILNMGVIKIFYQGMNNAEPSPEQKQLERGSCFLVIDGQGRYKDEEDRVFLNHVLQPIDILKNTLHNKKLLLSLSVASGLLPSWHHRLIDVVSPIRTKMYKELVLATYRQPELIKHAEGITAILGRCGVRCRVDLYDYHTFMMSPPDGVDLWLTNIMLDDESSYSLQSWITIDPIMAKVGAQWQHAKKEAIENIRCAGHDTAENELGELVRKFTFQRWFIPLVHHWIDCDAPESPSATKITSLGWADFSKAWFDVQ